MRISPTTVTLSLVVLLGALRTANAADVAVYPPEISNLPAQEADVVASLIAQAYASVSQLNVIAPAQTTPALAQHGGNHSVAAQQLGVREYIRLSAVSAEPKLVITAGRYLADGRLLAQLRQNVESRDQLPLAADNIARGLFSGVPNATPVAAQASLPPLAPPPPPSPKKKHSDTIYGIKTGVHLPFAKNASFYPAVSLQFNGRLQLPHAFVEFGAGFIIPTTLENNDYDYCDVPPGSVSACDSNTSNHGFVGGLTTELGASYYLTEGNVAPYVGGGIIPRVILAGLDSGQDKHDIASMSLYAQFGLTVPRERSTRFFVDLRLAQAVLEQHLQNGRAVWPTEPSLHAGIGW